MTARRLSRPASTDLVGLGLLVGAAGLAFIAANDIGAVIDGFSTGAERIELSSHAPAALPGAVGLASFAALLLRRHGTPRGDGRLMAFALACIPLMLLLPIAYLLAGRAVLTRHGYERCETEARGRHIVQIWHRPPGLCP